jgi:predicted alpha/beta-fold hydrolase
MRGEQATGRIRSTWVAPVFRPLPFLTHRHLQTIVGAKLYMPIEPPSVTKLVGLADGDRIALEVSTPTAWQPDAPTVVMIHGLCGCHRSAYMMRLAYKLWRRGIRAVRMNLRGCGSGKGLARQPYHSGRSADVLTVLAALRQETPQSPLTLVGFSLGGNIALKLAGELRAMAAAYLRQVIAVCPPADLAACVRLFAQPANRLYERHFMRRLQADVADRYTHFPDLPRVELSPELSLYAFDNLYTAPLCGFHNADDYYAQCSAAPLVPSITIPCRMLFAADDPFIDATVFDTVELPSNVQVVRTTHGGHLGFLGLPGGAGGYRWMDTLLLEWIGALTASGV